VIPPDQGANATDQVERLIALLAKLPGMGRRSARRAALKLLRDPAGLMLPLAEAMRSTAAAVSPCRICGNLDAQNPCRVCTDPNRDQEMVCVVEGVADLWALERARVHRGLYHVLGGVLSALSGVGPEDLRVEELLSRVKTTDIQEVILALPATVDGATTAHYLHDRLRSSGITVTRLAQGVPMGGALDVMDDGTLAAALKSRRPA
jgi:recombination protein RecR